MEWVKPMAMQTEYLTLGEYHDHLEQLGMRMCCRALSPITKYDTTEVRALEAFSVLTVHIRSRNGALSVEQPYSILTLIDYLF
jgi:hypothetical protein